MEGDELGAEQVPAGGKVGDGDVVLALSSNELVNTPVGGSASVLPKLDPDIARTIAGSRGNVDKDGALVGLLESLAIVHPESIGRMKETHAGNDIVAGGPGVVMPLESELVTRLN